MLHHIRRDSESQGRSLSAVLLADPGAAACHLIAEVKRRSPSAGILREDLDPAALASTYVAAGAAAISVLTEPTRFGGSLGDLEKVAQAVDVPVLCKDFLLEPAQIRRAGEAGADAVLLIVRLLEPGQLAELLDCARDAHLEPLVEIHRLEELVAALEAGAELIGVNNRDLGTLETNVRHSLEIAGELRRRNQIRPRIAISESGISSRPQVLELAAAGYRGVLVGETLLRASNPGRAVRELLGMTDA